MKTAGDSSEDKLNFKIVSIELNGVVDQGVSSGVTAMTVDGETILQCTKCSK